MITGMSLSNAVSAEIGTIRGAEADGKIQLRLILYSLSAKWASVKFQYRRDDFDEWKDDAEIIASNAISTHENEMIGLPCSNSGAESTIVWNHSANGLGAGSRCSVRAVVTPSVYVAVQSGEWSNIDILFKYNEATNRGAIEGSAIGLDANGNIIVLEDHYVLVKDSETHEILFSTPRLDSPRHAVGIESGGIIVIEADGGITEFDDVGVVVRTYDGAAIASGEARLAYNCSTWNILVSGGSIAKVTELSWGGFDHGTILWTHGSGVAGSGTNDLDTPAGVSYGDSSDIVVICDKGNNRVVIADRTNTDVPIRVVESVEVEEQTITIQSPVSCVLSGESLHVCEESGVERHFSSTPLLHPALARSGLASSGEDSLTQYAGIRFVPLVGSIQ